MYLQTYKQLKKNNALINFLDVRYVPGGSIIQYQPGVPFNSMDN